MPRFSVLAVMLGAFAAGACSSADAGVGAKGGGDTTPSDENVGQTTEALSAYLTTDGTSPVPIDHLEIHADARTSEELTRQGCGSFVKPGEGRVVFRAGHRYPTGFVDWAKDEIAGTGTAPSAAKSSPKLMVVIVSKGHDGHEDEAKCRVDLGTPAMEQISLNFTKVENIQMGWELRGGVQVAAGDLTGDGIGDGAGLGEQIDDIVAPDDGPMAIGLLLPAVQKVREAAARGHADGEYPIFKRGVPVPPPFEVEVDEEAFDDLIDGATGDDLDVGVLTLGPQKGGTHTSGGGGGAGKVSMRDFHFVVKLKKQAIAGSRTKLEVVPAGPFGIVSPLSDAQLDAARTKAESLATEAPAEISLEAVSRLVTALDKQPFGSGDASSRRDALLWYWRGDPAKGTAGAATSFDKGLGSFLETASDVEGLWAYKRLPTAARIFSLIDSPHGRALSEAATHGSADAAFPLRPGRLRTIGTIEGHDYRIARAAVAEMAAIADIIVGAGPGGSALAGIEPDEIDVANESKSEAFPAVSPVDAAAKSFLLARDALLDAPTVDDAALTDLAAKSAALSKELEALRAVTTVRFAVAK